MEYKENSVRQFYSRNMIRFALGLHFSQHLSKYKNLMNADNCSCQQHKLCLPKISQTGVFGLIGG